MTTVAMAIASHLVMGTLTTLLRGINSVPWSLFPLVWFRKLLQHPVRLIDFLRLPFKQAPHGRHHAGTHADLAAM
jgi:hypothetical protein